MSSEHVQNSAGSSRPAVPKLIGLRTPFAVKYFSRTPKDI